MGGALDLAQSANASRKLSAHHAGQGANRSRRSVCAASGCIAQSRVLARGRELRRHRTFPQCAQRRDDTGAQPATRTRGQARRDEKLAALIAEAYEARRLVLAQPDKTIAAIAKDIGKCRTRLGKLAGLACMAPDIVTAIVEGRQPPSLTTRTLMAADLPTAWVEQRAALGFV